MNRKRVLIISITGITVIFLALLGLTYGYFLTKIQGNTNTTSVTLTTTDLQLIYSDGTTQILMKDNLMPGTVVATKDFSVTNSSESNINEYQVYLENIINTFTEDGRDDVILKISCKSSISGQFCMGYEGAFPLRNSKLISNKIASKETHNYTLTIEYIETYTDQSADMGKEIKGKIQIYDPNAIVSIAGTVTGYESGDYISLKEDSKTSMIAEDGTYIITGIKTGNYTLEVKDKEHNVIASKNIDIKKGDTPTISNDGTNIVINDVSTTANLNLAISNINNTMTLNGINIKNEIPFDENTLAYKILYNTLTSSIHTNLRTVPKSNPGRTNSEVGEVSLIETNDLYTQKEKNSSYYYRGSVEDNYIEFNNWCWRIVRIQGDGSIKIALAAQKQCSAITEEDTTTAFLSGVSSRFGYGIITGKNDINWYFSNYGGSTIAAAYEDIIGIDWENRTSETVNTTSGLKDSLETWFNNNFLEKDTKELTSAGRYLKEDTWCTGASYKYKQDKNGVLLSDADLEALYQTTGTYIWYYSSRTRIEKNQLPNLLCENEDKIVSYIGTLSADEITLAGGVYTGNKQYDTTYYLQDNANGTYWIGTILSFQADDERAYYVKEDGTIVGKNITNKDSVRPVVTLKADTLYQSGNGFKTEPYIIN